jgi:hypothetical protein
MVARCGAQGATRLVSWLKQLLAPRMGCEEPVLLLSRGCALRAYPWLISGHASGVHPVSRLLETAYTMLFQFFARYSAVRHASA